MPGSGETGTLPCPSRSHGGPHHGPAPWPCRIDSQGARGEEAFSGVIIVFHAKTVHQIKILVQGASGPVLVWSAASGAVLWNANYRRRFAAVWVGPAALF